MEQPTKSQTQNSEPVIGAQCSRPLVQSWESYTKEQACGRDPLVNAIIQEKSDSNIPFIQNSKELASCKSTDQTIKVLTGFMQSGFDDFEKIYGFPMEQLEKDWLNTIKTIQIPKNIDENMLMANGCG